MPGSSVQIPEKNHLKRGSLKRLNEYISPILADQDPDEGIEEEYKKKYDQLFSWRFLRAISYVDQVVGKNQKSNHLGVNGNIERTAEIIHDQASKRPVIQIPTQPEMS